MGLLDRLLGREQFTAQASIGDPAFASWLMQSDDSQEVITPYTVLGLSAVLRAVSIIATTIAGLPLKTYERGADGTRVQIESEFDDPYPGEDGMVPFAWVETVLMHLLIWRQAFLWHEARADGTRGFAYRPIIPDAFKVARVAGRRVFTYRESGTAEPVDVGSEQITYIPGPSVNGTSGHPLLYSARAVFSAAISGDRTAQRVLKRGIRIAGLITPGDNEQDDFDETEGEAILESIRSKLMGSENAGDVLALNRRVKLQPWAVTSNIEAQWHETLGWVLMQIEQLFGIPPHLMADTEKQTSWGTGVGEQNLSLARFTLRGWSDRIEQVLSRRLPPGQFVEFDYKGLLQGTPAEEIRLVIEQLEAGLISLEHACRVLNLPAPTPEQQQKVQGIPQPVPLPIKKVTEAVA